MNKLLLLGLSIFVLSCSTKKKTEKDAFLASLDSIAATKPIISDEVVDNIVEMMPTPLEITFLLKDADIKYDNEILNSAESVEKYVTNYKKALNLGIYGTDLGYANVYKENQHSLKYLSSIKALADELNIGRFFDYETLKKLSSRSNDLDSLLLLTTQNFNHINSYLQKQNRENISALMLTGGWLEALHVLCQINKENRNSLLVEKIGEQKIILNKLQELFTIYRQYYPDVAILDKSFKNLYLYYDNVTIEFVEGEPTFVEEDGMLVIKDNSFTKIKISESDLSRITREVELIRNNIIQ